MHNGPVQKQIHHWTHYSQLYAIGKRGRTLRRVACDVPPRADYLVLGTRCEGAVSDWKLAMTTQH